MIHPSQFSAFSLKPHKQTVVQLACGISHFFIEYAAHVPSQSGGGWWDLQAFFWPFTDLVGGKWKVRMGLEVKEEPFSALLGSGACLRCGERCWFSVWPLHFIYHLAVPLAPAAFTYSQGTRASPLSEMSSIFQLFQQPLASSTKASGKRRHVVGHLVKWLAPRWKRGSVESHPGSDLTLQILCIFCI